jgi:hypothetical protein
MHRYLNNWNWVTAEVKRERKRIFPERVELIF